jgi:hypothetical protein
MARITRMIVVKDIFQAGVPWFLFVHTSMLPQASDFFPRTVRAIFRACS